MTFNLNVHTRVAALAMALTALAVPALAQQSLADLEAAAKAEGRLLIYSANQDAEMEAKLTAFEAKYPEIAADYIRLPSSQVFTRFMAEHDAGVTQADLLTTGSTALYQTNPELFIELGTGNIPDLAAAKPLIGPENSHYVVYQSDVQLVTYNSEAVSQDDLAQHLATWEGLADPFWKGRIALVDPRNSANQLSFLLGMQRLYGDEWFAGLLANEPEIVGTASAASQQVAAGAFDILVPTVPVQSAAVRAQGAPLGLYKPEGFNHVPAQGAAVAVGAANPNAALLFVNWMFSQEAQALQCSLGSVPNIVVEDPACQTTVPAEHSIGRDVIPADEAAHIYGLIGLQP